MRVHLIPIGNVVRAMVALLHMKNASMMIQLPIQLVILALIIMMIINLIAVGTILNNLSLLSCAASVEIMILVK